MRPVDSPDTSRLRGVNYYVDKDGSLQAYEYTESEVLDISKYATFITEFCDLVVKRGLQHKLGLKLKSDWEITNWTEFEFPCERSTLIIPKGMPIPEGEFGISVNTEWGAKGSSDGLGDPQGRCSDHDPSCTHCEGHCVSHCRNHHTAACISHCDYHCKSHCKHCETECHKELPRPNDDEWYLGGQKIEPGTPVHDLVTAVIKVW